MNPFYRDIFEQPQALRRLATFYSAGAGAALLDALQRPRAALLTGMGASFHAALVAAFHLRRLGISATAAEATDLLFYDGTVVNSGGQLVFISQSGASAEVLPLAGGLPADITLLAVTNEPESSLGQRAAAVLPIVAGPGEATVASRTYINTLAALWLLARRWGAASGGVVQALLAVAEGCERLLAGADSIAERWVDRPEARRTLVFLGHGPHAATARQAAMMLGEWAKAPALYASVGAFRHGFIEIAQPDVGVVIFTAPGPAHASSLALAAELEGYGAAVLLVEQGHTRAPGDPPLQAASIDEFLAPILDVIPAQLFVESLARRRQIAPEFRYIAKVVTRL